MDQIIIKAIVVLILCLCLSCDKPQEPASSRYCIDSCIIMHTKNGCNDFYEIKQHCHQFYETITCCKKDGIYGECEINHLKKK